MFENCVNGLICSMNCPYFDWCIVVQEVGHNRTLQMNKPPSLSSRTETSSVCSTSFISSVVERVVRRRSPLTYVKVLDEVLLQLLIK